MAYFPCIPRNSSAADDSYDDFLDQNKQGHPSDDPPHYSAIEPYHRRNVYDTSASDATPIVHSTSEIHRRSKNRDLFKEIFVGNETERVERKRRKEQERAARWNAMLSQSYLRQTNRGGYAPYHRSWWGCTKDTAYPVQPPTVHNTKAIHLQPSLPSHLQHLLEPMINCEAEHERRKQQR